MSLLSSPPSLQEVTRLIQSEGDKDIVDIELASGEVVHVTAGHPFYVPDSERSWVEADELDTSMLLYSIAGNSIGLTDLRRRQHHQKVYNLTVDQDHNYFVGLEGVLAHNTGSCDIWRNIWGKRNQGLFKKNLGPAPAGMINPRAHHIVQIGAVKFEKLQEKLAIAGITGNSAHNGVWIPNSFHSGLHTKPYYEYLENRLRGIDDAAGIKFVLGDVAEELANGIKNF